MIPKLMIFGRTKADIVYHRPTDDGVIFVLKYNGKNEKKHMTVDKLIETLDNDMKVTDKKHKTFFKSINDEDPRSSKVLSFERGARRENHLYRKLFDEKDRVLPGVIVWTKPGNDNESSADEYDSEEEEPQSKKMKLTLGDGNPGSVVDEIINKEQDIEHHLVSELKKLQQEAEDLKSKLATSKDETASYKKSAEFYETQYNDYKDQMEDAGVVGSTEYYKKKAEDLEKKFNGLDGSEVEKFKELNTNYNRELEFAEQREGEIFDLKAKVLIGFILVHTLELTTPFRWGG